MAPVAATPVRLSSRDSAPTRSSLSIEGHILEAWAEGYNLGSLVILVLFVLCNYRRGVILHKLILLELFFASFHGTFIFCNDPTYGWYLSSTATLLFISYQLHNVASWLKIKPFLPRWGSLTFIISLIVVQPYWVVEAWDNFMYFNRLGNDINIQTRPYEVLFRDPWWIFTTCRLVWIIKRDYSYTFYGLIRTSPRFGIMLMCMLFSIIFLLADTIVSGARLSQNSGINPYWRLSLVFKCASDTIFLDDFKSVLDNIVDSALQRAGGSAGGARYSRRKSSGAGVFDSSNDDGNEGKGRKGSKAMAESRLKPNKVVTTISTDGSARAGEPGGRSSSLGRHRDASVGPRERSIEWSIPAVAQAAAEGRRLPKLQIQQETTISTDLEGEGSRSSSKSSAPPVAGPATSNERMLGAAAAPGGYKPTSQRSGRKLSVDQWGDVIGDEDDDNEYYGQPPSAQTALPPEGIHEMPGPPPPAKTESKASRFSLPR